MYMRSGWLSARSDYWKSKMTPLLVRSAIHLSKGLKAGQNDGCISAGLSAGGREKRKGDVRGSGGREIVLLARDPDDGFEQRESCAADELDKVSGGGW